MTMIELGHSKLYETLGKVYGMSKVALVPLNE